jgi:hypothetical protein
MICSVCWGVGGTIGRKTNSLNKVSQSIHTNNAPKGEARGTGASQRKEREKKIVSEIIYVFFHRLDFNLG